MSDNTRMQTARGRDALHARIRFSRTSSSVSPAFAEATAGNLRGSKGGLPSRSRGNWPVSALRAPTRQPSHRFASEGWWSQTESNRRPPACKAGALPTELWPLTQRRTQVGKPSSKIAGWLAEPKRAATSPPSPFGLRRGSLRLAARAKVGGPGKI